jgi:TRAP-type mannitol/chloroaromatic compound transport system permease small subunit
VYFLLPAAYNFAERSWLQGERAATGANLPVYPGKTLIPLGITFLAVQAIAHVLKNLVFIFTDRKI